METPYLSKIYKYIHISAVFDTIDHGTLLECSNSWFGVGGVVLEWFKSYLSARLQCVKIGSILCGVKKLLFGVPQVSVLGPILYSPQQSDFFTVNMYTYISSRGGTSTNNSGRLLADQKSTRHRALAKFSIHHYRNQHPIWRLP